MLAVLFGEEYRGGDFTQERVRANLLVKDNIESIESDCQSTANKHLLGPFFIAIVRPMLVVVRVRGPVGCDRAILIGRNSDREILIPVAARDVRAQSYH